MPLNLNALRAEHLIETEALATLLAQGTPNLRIVDLRGYVRTQTDSEGVQTATYLGAPAEYAQAHLPEAIYLDWTQDIVDENDPVPAQIAPPTKMSRILGERGIGDESLVVVYDSHPAAQFATRLWWALRYYGFTNVRVLNGGWKKWTAEGRETTNALPQHPPATFTPRPQPAWRKTAVQVLEALGSPKMALLDARDEGQFTGKIRRGAFGGHIPGAQHLPREAFFSAEGAFLPTESLQALVSESGIEPNQEVVAYCNGGVAATSVLFTLSLLGYEHLSNYDGSWNEWGNREDLPHEQSL